MAAMTPMTMPAMAPPLNPPLEVLDTPVMTPAGVVGDAVAVTGKLKPVTGVVPEVIPELAVSVVVMVL